MKNSNLKARYVEWDAIGLAGIVGKAGTGKSSTLRFILAQMALGGTGVILCDGHGKISAQNLISTTEGLTNAFILTPASDDSDIVTSIRAAAQIAHNRLNGIDKDIHYRIALVVDEYVSILQRLEPEVAHEVIDIIIKFADQYRKTGVKCFIAAQNWTADFIGSAAIRRSLNLTVLHRMAPDEIKLFSSHPIVRKESPLLRVGEAFILDQSGDPVKVYVPKITMDDLKAIAHLVPNMELPQVETPYEIPRNSHETFRTVSSSVSPLQSGISHISYDDKTQKNMRIWYNEIKKLSNQGLNKAQIIYALWEVSPGSSKRYKIASTVYDYLKGKM